MLRAGALHVGEQLPGADPAPRAVLPRSRLLPYQTVAHCVQVDKVNVSYNVLWNAFKLISTELFGAVAGPEKDALFAGTAIKAYRLDVTLPAQQPAAL